MDSDLERILDARLARGEIDAAERERLARHIEETNAKLYGVLLNAAGPRKLEIIKAVRAITGCGLKEAKHLVEAAPVTVVEGLERDTAAIVVQNLLNLGARADLAPYDSASLIPAQQAAAQARAQAASGCLLMAAALILALLALL